MNYCNYKRWNKTDLVNKIRDLQMQLLELQNDIRSEKNLIKWRYKMKLNDVVDDKTNCAVVTARISKEDRDFLKENSISLARLITVAIKELRQEHFGMAKDD